MSFRIRRIRLTGPGKILALLLALLAVGLLHEGWRLGRDLWHAARRARVVYKLGIRNGIALSLNEYQKKLGRGVRLPGLDFKGALYDRSNDDWVLFGEAGPLRPGLPLDAVAIAMRVSRTALEAPGIDIQPRGADRRGPVQQVRYFGGVENTVVGAWFFQFDYWMKRASLDREPKPVPGLPVYWRRAVAELERDVASCASSGRQESSRGNRYWLCAGEFRAVEDGDALVFQSAPLRVLAEKLEKANWAPGAESPCVSRGTDDPLAAEFANWLTMHLAEVASLAPAAEIEDFAHVMASLAWLAEQDPQRELKPWLKASLSPAETPASVPTLAMETERSHPIPAAGMGAIHRHRLEISGGVLVSPTLSRVAAAGDSIGALAREILRVRPHTSVAEWSFSYSPP